MKILIAEDDPIARRQLEVNLAKWGYDVMACPDGNSAWEQLQQPESPSCIILNTMLSGMNSLKICRAIRQNEDSPHVFIILILPEKSQLTDIANCLDAGADQYLIQPFDRKELHFRLRHYPPRLSPPVNLPELTVQHCTWGIASPCHQKWYALEKTSESSIRYCQSCCENVYLVQSPEQLRQHAALGHCVAIERENDYVLGGPVPVDALTRLWNRAYICELLQVELEKAENEESPLSVLLVDLDFFKRINETYGHLTGDNVLGKVAMRIRRV